MLLTPPLFESIFNICMPFLFLLLPFCPLFGPNWEIYSTNISFSIFTEVKSLQIWYWGCYLWNLFGLQTNIQDVRSKTLTSLPCCDLQSRLCFHQPNLVSSQLVPKSGPKTFPANRLSLPLLHIGAKAHIWWLMPAQQQREEKLNCTLSWNTICFEEMWFFFFTDLQSVYSAFCCSFGIFLNYYYYTDNFCLSCQCFQ